jgi:two-component system, sensor histidine kinase
MIPLETATTQTSTLRGKVNLLLVDDREDGLLALEAVLSSPNLNLVKAKSGQEALAHLLNYDFALILMDVQMPEMDGFEAASYIKQNPRTQHIPIIFITAISKENSHIYKGYEAGAVDYLFKPFDPHILKSKVSVFIDLYQKTKKVERQAKLLQEMEKRERERKFAELELEGLRRYRNLADAIPHIVWKSTKEGYFDYFNQTWGDYTGLTLDESRGKAWQNVIEPHDLEHFLKLWEEVKSHLGSFETECRLKRKDGVSRWHLTRVVTELKNGDVVGWIVTWTDIHDRKQAEEEHKKAELAIVKHAQELEKSNKELEQFAYVASHDLQEPLRIVGSYAQLLRARYFENLDENGQEFIDFISQGAHRSQQLINDLLEYSRLRAQNRPLQLTPCNEVLKQALLNLNGLIIQEDAEIIADDLPEVMGDSLKLVQLFQNLIGNALKFRSKEKVPKIRIRISEKNKKDWQFSIEDNGIGIESQYAERIFIIFQRLHTSADYPGTGIGLALCKKIVEHHGGRIWVDSVFGKGSVFHFTLPRHS